ncbi:MAG TPA: YbgC/FadM family acyl-CoA thioesterase [Thermodesulfovibrionales bacterium]|jgi:acyl-CoA thioester hydrolase|nr:YbgC/FadM family acyl-CoA thioesterase [Thermodesulfovibrionales bacterium]
MDDHSYEKKIYYHDTDCGGVVYYANYLKYLEEARTEFFLVKGVDLKKLSKDGIIFVVARVEIDYKLPARYQDTIRILTSIENTRPAAIRFSQRILRVEKVVSEAKTTLVCVGKNLRPIAIPEEIRILL